MAAEAENVPIPSSCHCGAIKVTVPRLPQYTNYCQCTICRRYGVAWAYYHPDEVKIETKPDAITRQYIWGDRTASFNFCDNCGCMCYWWPLGPRPTDGEEYMMGVNTNNMDPEVLKYVDRKFSYSYVKVPMKAKDATHPEDLATY
ncbi:uncharacterized protein PV06_02598 [Exophiala oligosperma]|nr:uncharacterized protein PV06_02598 [Exophiala oligosperma]KIW46981.1 hypothetical protein PV06_02598 [Exophiala oligosperma]